MPGATFEPGVVAFHLHLQPILGAGDADGDVVERETNHFGAQTQWCRKECG